MITVQACCPDCRTWLTCEVSASGYRFPAHPQDPGSVTLCIHSLAVRHEDGLTAADDETAAGLLLLSADALAAAVLVEGLSSIREGRAT